PGFCQAVAQAVGSRDWQHVADMNGEVENGYCSVPISSSRTQRISTAMGYLSVEARRRPTLRLLTDTFVEGLLFDGKRALGLRAAPNLALRYDSKVEGCEPHDMYISVTNKSSWHPLGSALGALVVCVYKPYSRGSVNIDTIRPTAEPRIEFNLLRDDRDLRRL